MKKPNVEIETIPNEDRIQRVWFNPSIYAICSIGKKPFEGVANITYEPKEVMLEFVSVEEFIDGLKEEKTTIEGLARILFDALVRVLGDIPLQVVINARTTVHAPAGAMIRQGRFEYYE